MFIELHVCPRGKAAVEFHCFYDDVQANNYPLHINIDQAYKMIRHHHYAITIIDFIGLRESIYVTETPEEIMTLMRGETPK